MVHQRCDRPDQGIQVENKSYTAKWSVVRGKWLKKKSKNIEQSRERGLLWQPTRIYNKKTLGTYRAKVVASLTKEEMWICPIN